MVFPIKNKKNLVKSGENSALSDAWFNYRFKLLNTFHFAEQLIEMYSILHV
jgi:hypothetical protein